MKQPEPIEVRLDKIVGGGQALGTMPDGRKLFAWGGLPGELVRVQITKKKSSYLEGIVTEVIEPSPERSEPLDADSYLSTSPWQIMTFSAEQRYKVELVHEAFKLHQLTLPESTEVYTDGRQYRYRNKVEFSWYSEHTSDPGRETLELAFYRRGSKGKIIIQDSALLPEGVVRLAHAIKNTLYSQGVTARQLKTLLIRSDKNGNCVWQLYVKDTHFAHTDTLLASNLPARGGEVIFSNPNSPASVISERLGSTGETILSDTLLGVPFRYATEGFFQVNLPVYEQSLLDIQTWIRDTDKQVVDLYSGVGSIGLTIGGQRVTLVESNEHAVREMKQNIERLGIQATPVLATSEEALEYITGDKIIIVDPPRAGLHTDVIHRLLEAHPDRILYLSCNPTTQARDISLLHSRYAISFNRGYNFFPRTPHIEHLVVLEAK